MAIGCIGSAGLDMVLTDVVKFPETGQAQTAKDGYLGPGGCACNVALAIARMGHSSKLFARVARDRSAPSWSILIDEMQREKHLSLIPLEYDDAMSLGPSLCFCAVHPPPDRPHPQEKQRSFVMYGSRGVSLTVEDLRAKTEALLECDYLILAGMGNFESLETNPEFGKFLQDLKRDSGGRVRIVADVVSAEGWTKEKWTERLNAWIRQVDYFCPNEIEAKAIAGKSTHREAAKAIQAMYGIDKVIITRDTKGVYVLNEHQLNLLSAFRSDRVVDPTGAGDAWCAGFAVGLASGEDVERAAELGNAAASFCIEEIGACSGIPSLKRIKQRRDDKTRRYQVDDT